MSEKKELKDLPKPNPQLTPEVYKVQKDNDLVCLERQYLNQQKRLYFFWGLYELGLSVGAGCMVTIEGKAMAYLVTSVDFFNHEISVTKYDFWEKSHRVINLISYCREERPFDAVTKIEGHTGTFIPADVIKNLNERFKTD